MEKKNDDMAEYTISIVDATTRKAYESYKWSGDNLALCLEVIDDEGTHKCVLDQKTLKQLKKPNYKRGFKRRNFYHFIETFIILSLSLIVFVMQLHAVFNAGAEGVSFLYECIKWTCFSIAFILIIHRRLKQPSKVKAVRKK